MLDSLRFVKYVRSFMDGRVRVRHPALRDAAIAGKARAALLRVDGVRDIELNPLSGSAVAGQAHRDRLPLGRLAGQSRTRPGRRDAALVEMTDTPGERLFADKSSLPRAPLPKNFQVRAQVPVAASWSGTSRPDGGPIQIASSLGAPVKKGRRHGVLFSW